MENKQLACLCDRETEGLAGIRGRRRCLRAVYVNRHTASVELFPDGVEHVVANVDYITEYQFWVMEL